MGGYTKIGCSGYTGIGCSVTKIKALKSQPNRLFSRLFIITYGGDKGDRTPDLLIANQALSQLSYIPMRSFVRTTNEQYSGTQTKNQDIFFVSAFF